MSSSSFKSLFTTFVLVIFVLSAVSKSLPKFDGNDKRNYYHYSYYGGGNNNDSETLFVSMKKQKQSVAPWPVEPQPIQFILPESDFRSRIQMVVHVGNPPKPLVLAIDFGTKNFMMIDENAKSIPAQMPKYRPQESSSAKELNVSFTNLWFGNGRMVEDVISFHPNLPSSFPSTFPVGEQKPLSSPFLRQPFAIVVPREPILFNGVSGIIGLILGNQDAKEQQNGTANVPSFLSNVFQQQYHQLANTFTAGTTSDNGRIVTSLFTLSFWFQSKLIGRPSFSPITINGTITFNGTDQKNCLADRWTYTPSVTENHWHVALDSLDILWKNTTKGATTLKTDETKTFRLDTYAMMWAHSDIGFAPLEQVRKLALALGGPGEEDFPEQIPCNSTAHLRFRSADGTFSQVLSPEEYVVPEPAIGGCVLSFLGWELDAWLFGTRFLSHRCLQLKHSTVKNGGGGTESKLEIGFTPSLH